MIAQAKTPQKRKPHPLRNYHHRLVQALLKQLLVNQLRVTPMR